VVPSTRRHGRAPSGGGEHPVGDAGFGPRRDPGLMTAAFREVRGDDVTRLDRQRAARELNRVPRHVANGEARCASWW
jgi:hypothetical protein